MDRKWLIVFPSLFTVSSIFCGIYAILNAAGPGLDPAAANAANLRAAIAILCGMFLDGCDGRVARMTHTQSDFGVQLDSLADVVSFGAAPAVLLYKWALSPLGFWGMFVVGLFAAAGAIRLARFNVMASRSMGPSNFFVGLPIPLAAGMVVAVVIAATAGPQPQQVRPLPVAILTVVLSYLMVSTIRYHSFKKVQFQPKHALIVAGVALFGVAVAARGHPSLVPVAYFSGYVLLGLVEEIVFRRRRAETVPVVAGGAAAMIPADDDDAGTD